MTHSTLITDYMGYGLHSARPASPNVPSGGTAIYYETDTSHAFAWTGSAWVQIDGSGGGGSSPTFVQDGAIAASTNANSITLGSAPTSGNLLIAFISNGGGYPLSSDWSAVNYIPSGKTWPDNGGGVDFSNLLWKVAGPSESATQTPHTNASSAGAMVIVEVANGAPSIPTNLVVNSASTSFPVRACKTGGLLIGALLADNSTALPTGISGMTLGNNSSGGGHSAQAYRLASPTAGDNTVAYTYASSTDVRQFGLVVF